MHVRRDGVRYRPAANGEHDAHALIDEHVRVWRGG
jgi:hypothetical protein